MESGWWSSVLLILGLPAQVALNSPTVSQLPPSTSVISVNSSFMITCGTVLSEPMGLSLYRGVQRAKQLVYLSFQDGKISKETISEEFKGRVVAGVEERAADGCSVRLSLSLLQLQDTNFYLCSWTHLNTDVYEVETHSSKGSIIIVREEPKDCIPNVLDFILISLSAAAFTFILLISTGALILRCRKFKTDFRTARAVTTSRANRPVHVCPHRRTQHSPFLETSENTLDFSRIF